MLTTYMSASDNGRLPANARQIMYAARPYILKTAGRDSFFAFITLRGFRLRGRHTLKSIFRQSERQTWGIILKTPFESFDQKTLIVLKRVLVYRHNPPLQ